MVFEYGVTGEKEALVLPLVYQAESGNLARVR
jgi:hypothetical protein